MNVRIIGSLAAAAVLAAFVAPAAIGADLTDVGFVDQAQLANMPAFAGANRALAGAKAQMDAQYNAAVRHASSDAARQQITLQFQQAYSDKQREIVGPMFQRAQLAIAQVSAAKNLSVVVDKRIVIFGGQDITRDVETLFSSGQAIQPPAASPPPSEIGFVDQTVLDNVAKVKAANDQMSQYEQTQRTLFAPQLAAAKTDADKKKVFDQYNKAMSDKQDQLLKPLVEETKRATASVAASKKLLLVIDRADVIYGGTDITADVQNDLAK
jgi:outer membrane protein